MLRRERERREGEEREREREKREEREEKRREEKRREEKRREIKERKETCYCLCFRSQQGCGSPLCIAEMCVNHFQKVKCELVKICDRQQLKSHLSEHCF